jgi:hypothetical protein
MSYSFRVDTGSPILWNPSNGPGRAYVGIAKVIAADPEVPDLSTWLTEWTPDDHLVDPQGLAVFLHAVLDSSIVGNAGYLGLARGFIEQSLALSFAAGGDIKATNPGQAELIDTGRELARIMVR